MRKKRILVLVHDLLVPPEEVKASEIDRYSTEWVTEYDVITQLKKLGHQVEVQGVFSDITKIRTKVEEFKPHIVFNLLEEFDGESLFDQNVVSYLELLRMPYTGCNPRGLILGRDKSLAKKILNYHRIKTPQFQVFPRNKKVKLNSKLPFPMIVKCLNEEASLGISQASIVQTEDKLMERVNYLHSKFGVDVIVEQFIEGREFYVGVMGNYRIETLPVWELVFSKADNPEKELYSRRAKWNEKYRNRKGIKTGKAKLEDSEEKRIQTVAKKTYKALNLNGYARIDLRMDDKGDLYIIEANPNPNIASDDEFANSAAHLKIKYGDLLEKLIKLGLQWSPV